MALLRQLNEDGVTALEKYLIDAKSDPTLEPPYSLLYDPEYSVEFQLGEVELEMRRFEDRRAFASYIDECFVGSGVLDDVDTDGVWDWLTLFYLDTACPLQRDGTRKIGELNRYLINPSLKRNPKRHLLRSAYLLHRRFRDESTSTTDVLMGYPIDNYPLLWTHLNERPTLMGSSGVLNAARELYYDSKSGNPKRGLGAATNGVRRFGKVAINLPSEFNLSTLSSTTVLALLPSEFDDWIEDSDRRREIREARNMLGVEHTPGRVDDGQSADAHILSMSNSLESLAERPRQVVDTVRQLRNDMFRATVLKVYGARCTVSGLGLIHEPTGGGRRYEVEAAHIIPVSKGGKDIVSNGLPLNRTVHWAFDNGMIWIGSDYTVHLTPKVADNDRNRWLQQFDGRPLALPENFGLRPNPDALRWHARNLADVEGA